MLEGLEIKEKEFSAAIDNKDFRIDSQFYTKEPIKNPVLKYDKIGNHLIKAQYGISISMNEDGIGYPIYRMNEIHNMMCDSNVSKYADINKTELNTFVLNDRDVVFNRTNSFEWVGRTGLYKKKDFRDYVFASYLVRFIPNQDSLLPEYLTTFLNTKYGIWDIKRRARQSINQTNVNPEEVKEIEIPLLSIIFQKRIKDFFEKAHTVNLLSQSKYQEAENLLLETLGLKDFEPSKEPVNIKSFSESFGSSGRLDAEYYQKKYDEIENILLKSKKGAVTLGYVIEYIRTGEYSATYYPKSEKTEYYLRNTNFRNCNIIADNEYSVPKNEFGTSAVKGEILTSRVGTMGLFGVITDKLTGAVYSDNVLCFKLKNGYHPLVYAMLFSSKYYQTLIDKISGGSVQPLITQTSLKTLIVPNISETVQINVASLIHESFTLKDQSEQLLDLAKTAVEKAIEENEEKAMEYVNNSLNRIIKD